MVDDHAENGTEDMRATAPGEDLRMGVIRPVALFVEDRFGASVLEDAAEAAGMRPGEVRQGQRWISIAQAEAFLDIVFGLLGRDERLFRNAFCHRYAEAYGSLTYLLWAANPGWVILHAARTLPVVCRHGRYELIGQGKRELRWRYHSTRREGRLLCLARQGNVIAMPTLWGLPPGTITEHGCAALGDACCEYQVRWTETSRLTPFMLAGAATAALVAAASLAGTTWASYLLFLPLAASLAAHALELRRAQRATQAFAEDTRRALEEVVACELEARVQLAALQQRQARWGHAAEMQLQDRSAALREVVQRIEVLQDSRDTDMCGLSHDLRNPMQVLRITSALLSTWGPKLGSVAEAQLRDHNEALDRMERLLAELHERASVKEPLESLAQMEPVDVVAMSEDLAARARALVAGKPVAVTRSVDDSAPREVVVDRAVFDRVLDNLLTNAAKATQRGRIHLELAAHGGFLSVGVLDSGCGIEQTRLGELLALESKQPRQRTNGLGWGVGLSIVLRLLRCVGGRLQASSMPGRGSAFWALFPIRTDDPSEVRTDATEGLGQPLEARAPAVEIRPWHPGLDLSNGGDAA